MIENAREIPGYVPGRGFKVGILPLTRHDVDEEKVAGVKSGLRNLRINRLITDGQEGLAGTLIETHLSNPKSSELHTALYTVFRAIVVSVLEKTGDPTQAQDITGLVE